VRGFSLRVGVDMRAVATGLEERETQCVFAGEKGTTGESVAFTGDPITASIAFDVEAIGWADT
jgi:hypothetical protein